MICPDCGEEIKDSNQEFCNKCGSTISTSSEILFNPHKVALDLYSKRYLADGIISIVGAAISLLCGILIITFSILMELFFPLSLVQFIIRTTILIILVALYAIGLIFANASRSNSKKVKSFIPKNSTQKRGNVLWIIGVIINSIGLGIFLIVLFISMLNLF